MHQICRLCSIVLIISSLQGGINAREAIKISRLEDDLQLQDWGYVEGGHDIDESDNKVRILAASVFMRLLKIVSWKAGLLTQWLSMTAIFSFLSFASLLSAIGLDHSENPGVLQAVFYTSNEWQCSCSHCRQTETILCLGSLCGHIRNCEWTILDGTSLVLSQQEPNQPYKHL